MSEAMGTGAERRISLPLLHRAVTAIDRVSALAIVGTMAAMAGLVAAQVFYRYVLSSSIDSANELSRLFFVWSIFLALPHGIRYGVHVGIDLLPMAFSAKLRDAFFRAMNAVSAGLMLVVAVVSYAVVVDTWSELMPTLPMTAALYYVPVLIAAVHAVLHMVLLVWNGPDLWKDASL